MHHEILPNGNLRLVAEDPEELAEATTIEELLEPLIANSDLDWITPEICADLTSAPMLGICEYPEIEHTATRGDGHISAGHWEGKNWAYRVAKRWAWMSYAVADLLEHLKEHKEAILVGGSPWKEGT